ncbi:MAG: hypothetical protein RKO24_13750 [Candidatus Competibacter sp.]|nr:hypothetical protein [Candidatus Competibacter sp.]
MNMNEISATAEVATALNEAFERGLCRHMESADFDANRELRWWRGDNGVLYATSPTTIEPGARRIDMEWERGVGWRTVE